MKMDKNSMNPHQNHLGVNKLGKNIRKNPNHQNQPRVYNVSKTDFRIVVQQLTGSPNPLIPSRPTQPKNPNPRLKKTRRPNPPPLQVPNPNPNLNPNNPSTSALWSDSPVSDSMKYFDDSSRQRNPNSGPLSPWKPAMFPSPGWQFPLSSPNSQFLLQSPSSFLNVVSPKAANLLQYSADMAPNFSYLQLPQSGGLGTRSGVQQLASSSNLFAVSPSGSVPFSSPRWREK